MIRVFITNRLGVKRLFPIWVLMLFFYQSFSQQTFVGVRQRFDSPVLRAKTTEWEVYQFPLAALTEYVLSQGGRADIELGRHDWNLSIEPNPIFSPDYHLQVHSEAGIEKIYPTAPIAFRGTNVTDQKPVRLTFTPDMICGIINESLESWHVEPLWWHLPEAPHDQVVVYPRKAVIRTQDATCIEVEHAEMMEHVEDEIEHQHGTPDAPPLARYALDLAIASDASMLTKYFGSASAVEAHNVAVINDVEGDYTVILTTIFLLISLPNLFPVLIRGALPA